MKKFGLIAFGFLYAVLPAVSYADMAIHLQIETATTTLYKGDIQVVPCPITPESATTTASIYCAIEQAGIGAAWSFFGEDAFIDSIGGIPNDFSGSQFWLWWEDLSLGQTAANAHELQDGENVLIAIGTYPLRISVSSTTPTENSQLEAIVEEFGFDDAFDATWSPSDGATVYFGPNTFTTNAEGSATSTAAGTSTFPVYASKTGFIPSGSVSVSPVPLPDVSPAPVFRTIRLRIASSDSVLFDSDIAVEECEISPESASSTVNGMCAVENDSLVPEWSWFGDDAFVDSIGGIPNDFAASQFWLWWSGEELGQVALNKHELEAGEELLIAIGRYPLKLETATTSPLVGATTTFFVYEFAFDNAFAPVWQPSASSTIYIGTASSTTDASGILEHIFLTTATTTVYAEKSGFLTTIPLAFAPIVSEDVPASVTITSSSGGGGGGAAGAIPVFNVPLAVSFLSGKQKPDGSFGSAFLTDWAAIAFASAGPSEARDKVRAYLLAAPAAFTLATDYERRAMALMALGIDPYIGTSVDHIKEIASRFDGTQIGDASLINDDVFALFPLISAGFVPQDEIISKTAAYIVAKQLANGSFEGSVDFTAATIQALSLLQSLPDVPKALSDARSFLKNVQQDDAGFGNSFSTSWSLQAIAALRDPFSQWEKAGQTPYSQLASLQRNDGAIGESSGDLQSRLWATAYAIPAMQNKTWNSLLATFPKKEAAPTIPNGSANVLELATSSSPTSATSSPTTTSTLPVIPFPAPEATSTVSSAFATSTLANATSSPALAKKEIRIREDIEVPQPSAHMTVARDTQQAAAAVSVERGFLKRFWKGFIDFLRAIF